MRRKNMSALKLCVGFVLFIMVMSVLSGAVSASDVDTNSIDSGINVTSVVQNAGFNDEKDPKSLSYTALQTSVGILSYSSASDFLRIKVGEMYSGFSHDLDWTYLYDPVDHPDEFIHSIYREQYAIATNNWGDVMWSNSFIIDAYFSNEDAPDTSTLHYDNLSLTRHVSPPVGSTKSFSITYVLTNTGDSTLKNVRFFQGVDYDIYDAANDYAWYTEATDSVWQNDDNYFKNGFHGSRTSSHHDCNYYTSMWYDISSAQLNNQTKYPESGAADCGIALQWDAGDLLPQASWDLTITFYFGEAAGIEANAGPDQLVGRDQPVTFDASGSSSVSNITTYEWDFDNDGIFDVSVSTPIYVYEAGCTELGEYIVALRVTDDVDRNDMDTVKITVVPNVDLIVSNISFTPTKILDGDIVIFNATVENIGREALTEDFYVGFEIDGTYIGQKRISGGLLTGSSIHVLQSWGANAGAHNVSVYADSGYYSSENNLIPESNEINNVLSQALPEIPFPELAVTHLIWSPTENINDGDVVTFTATVENTGAGNTTSDFYVGFEIDGVHIGSRPITGLVAGGSINVTQSWDADAGNHAVKVIVDYDGEITESDESNNELSQTLPKIPFPDLTVTDISWSPQTDIRHGDTVTFTATVENIGVGNTSSNFYVRFEIDDSYMGHRKVSGGIAAGGSIGLNLNWGAFEGNHTVKAIVDEYNAITESNENNNEQSEVLPEIPQPPQVNVTSPNGGDVWYGARDITWEATSPEGLDLTIKLELYNGYSYKRIADALSNTGVYQNWDTVKFADGSSVPDSTYYKIRIIATDTGGVSGSNLSDDWFTIWNTPIVEISSAPSSQSTTESVNATYYLTVVNKQPSTDTFDLFVDNTDNAAVAELSQGSIALDPWGTGTVTQNITDEASGTYRVTVRAVSQTNASITGEVTIPTYVRDAFTTTVSAPRTQTSIGGVLTYEVEIANNQGTSDTLTLTVTGIDESWFSIDSFCYLTAGEIKTIPLEISIPDTASAGEFSLTLQATSSNLGTTKEALATLNVSAAPVIFDLIPGDNTRTGATEVLFTWTTSVNSTSEVFIKAQGEADYTLVSGDTGIFHAVSVSGLSRNICYDFYVRSNSTHGSATSEVRSVFIDNGIIFSQRTYEFTIERDYDQRRTITVINTDDEPHEVLLNVSGVPEDLVLNFVGEGSMDQVIPLHPGENKDVAIVLHTQDAQSKEYDLLLNLTSYGAEEITDFSYLKLHIHQPNVNFTVEEVDSDPFTLAKTLKVTNYGDSITDLSITADENLANILTFQPSISHGYLRTGASVEFKAVPMLSTDFTNINGDIIVAGSGENVTINVSFDVPEDKAIYVGSVPTTNISFASEFDEDELAATNPTQDDLVPSYNVKGTTLFTGRVMVIVLQDGEPASEALVRLKMWSLEANTISEAWTDRWGHAIFTIYGHARTFNYYVELPGYGLSTETRTFTVNSTPAFELTRDISWVSVSDSNSTFNFPTDETFITLDAAPYAFEAFKEKIADNTSAILYLQPYVEPEEPEVVRIALRMTTIDILGNITDGTLKFNMDGVPPGNYTASIFTYSANEISMSESLNLSITDDPWQRGALNFAIQLPLALNSTHFYDTYVVQEVVKEDPNRIIDLWYVQPANSTTMLLLTYMIRTTEDMVDTAVIEARDSDGEVFYSEIRTVTLEKDKIQLLNVYLPAYEENRIEEGFTVKLNMWGSDEGEVMHTIYEDVPPTGSLMNKYTKVQPIGVMPPGCYGPSGGGTLTEEQGLALIKCAAGLIPYVGLVINIYDFGKAIYESKYTKSMGTGGQIILDPVILKTTTKAVEKVGYEAGVRVGSKVLAKWAPVLGTLYGCADDFNKVIQKEKARIKPHGVKVNIKKSDWYCTNRPKVETSFTLPSSVHSPTVRPAGVGVHSGQWYYKSLPAHLTVRFTLPWSRDAYEPHDVHIYINDVEIGNLTNTIPEGVYTFDFNPQILNFADTGFSTNTIRLDTDHMNGGHYVVSGEYTISCDLRQISMPIVATTQSEADQAVKGYFEEIGNLPDLTMYPEEVSFSSETPLVDETIDVSANVYNFGSITEYAKVMFTFSGPTTETLNTTIDYIPSTGNATASVSWSPMAQGTYTVQVMVNPDQEINESDYTNNEASKPISVTAPDTTPPEISNPQPPDGSTTSDNTPLISADLADADSEINITAVKITVDDFDATQNATVTSSRVWYTPELALTNGAHNVTVYAEDNKGNNNSLQWSFTVATEKQPPIASFTYFPENPAVNETITFNASNSYDLDGFIINYEWEFGDGMEATGEIVGHSYSKSGDYIVILRVTDNDSLSHTNTMILTVTMVETAICGDVTGDSKVTMGDARRIEMWLSYPEEYPINNLWAADVTGDGEVTGDDARRIIMWLSDPELYPLTCSTP